MKDNMPNFKGIIPPLVTPLVDEENLDIPGLERLINHVIAGGVHGIFILGTTGESTSLSYKLRHELIKHTCKFVNKRVPVLVGITDTALQESLALAETASKEGASAVVAAPPYYFGLGQPELIEYYEHLAEHLPLPVFLYNMPSHTKINIEPETVHTLSKNPKIIGLKDSSANTAYFNKVAYKMKENENFSLFVGPEEITAEVVLMGASGGVNGGANMFPELYVKLYEAASSGDLETTQELHQQVMEISSKLYTQGKFGSSYLKGLKASLKVLGICNDYMASPLHQFRSKEKEIIAKNLKEITDKSK